METTSEINVQERARRSISGRHYVLAAFSLVAAASAGWMLSRSWGPGAARDAPAPEGAPQLALASASAALIPETRASANRRAVPVVPELPEQLRNPPALTVELEIRELHGSRPIVQRKTVTRTPERVHVSFGEKAPEWLFVRNPIDPRRLDGTMADHTQRVLVEYDESELRNGGLGRGWADIVSLGVQPETLGTLTPTGKERALAGFHFAERRSANAGPVQELWWSAEAGAFSRLVTVDGNRRTELSARRVQKSVNPLLLRTLRERFPEYRVIDVADYREKHHEGAGHGAGPAHDSSHH